MKKFFKYFLNCLLFTFIAGCASQEDALHSEVFGQDRGTYILFENEDVGDLGKTPRDKMLEERRKDEKNKNKSTKDKVIDIFILNDEKG